MSQEKNDNTYTAPNQAQKSQKEKTMVASRINSLATIDITQATTLEEQAIIMQNNLEKENSASAYSDNIASYYPGKYQKHTVVAEAPKKEEKKDGYISSYVGDYDSNPAKNRIANLGNDVAFVQGHLNRLGILSDEHFIAEKPATEKEINKSKIPHTIVAIEYFQREILSCKIDGEIWPGKGNIKSLVALTVEQKDAKHLEYLKNKKEAEAKAAADKAKAEKKAEIERIKKEPATEKNLQKYYTELGNIEAFGKFLKDYVILNPEFVIKAYDLMDFGESDNLTRAIMYNLKDSEIEKLQDTLDLKFYESLDAGWTVDEEYSMMSKLKAGKNSKNEVESSTRKTSEPLKFEKVDEKYKSGLPGLYGSRNNFNKYLSKTELKGDVGNDSGSKKAPNNKEDVILVRTKLKEKGFEVNSGKLSDLIVQIEAFQLTFLKKEKVDGNISPTGTTASKLGLNVSQSTIGSLSRTKDSKGEYTYSKGTDEKDYYSKTELISENIAKDDSKEENILKSAQEAATNEKYFKSITKELNVKLDWSLKDKNGESPKKENEGNKLSSVLEDRMSRFHKFCVALGIYKGNMLVSNAVRSKTKSHKWSAEHFILYNNKQDHWKTIKSNLIEMYNNPDYRIGTKVKDLDGNIWAIQKHFIFSKNDSEKNKAIGIDYSLVQEYVDQKKYRSNKKSIAAEGYISGNRRLPLPESGRPGRSKHITGDAIDINSNGFINKNDAIIDLIAINFGIVRCASGEQWHFECTDLRVSNSEQELVEHEKR
ncbi:MAG: hypothetical protein JEY96_19485 [Bacteroidales bacterium]|nr:hypothetical protein [Bacteroidales bacterium]